MSERLTSLVVAAALVIGIGGACGGARHDDDSTPWGAEAVELFDAVARGLSDADKYATSRFYDHGGVLDLRAWDKGFVVGRDGVADALGSMLYVDGRAAAAPGRSPDLDVDVERVFLGAEHAVVWFDAHGHAGMPWVELYALDRDSVLSSRLYTEDLGHVLPEDRFARVLDHDFYDRYVEVWSSGDPDRLGEVYAESAVSRWALTGEEWAGLGELAGLMQVAPPVAAGPWPERFGFDVPPHHEKVAVVQVEGACPMLEARRWVLDGGLIVDETRFAHVESVRRCSGTLDDGWWVDFEPAAGRVDVIRTIDVADQQVQLVNANLQQSEFVMWLFDRFRLGALAWPEVAAVWFPPSVDCDVSEGVAKRHDDRADDRSSITLCFNPDAVASGWSNFDWSPAAVQLGLHELAHVWMYSALDESTRRAFVDRVGVSSWRDVDVFWPERGVEIAADTISWGLAGDRAVYTVEPVPECAELAARYELLTGRPPVTTCPGPGGSP